MCWRRSFQTSRFILATFIIDKFHHNPIPDVCRWKSLWFPLLGGWLLLSAACPWLFRSRHPDIRKHSLSILFQELRIFPELTAIENIQLKNRLTNFKKRKEVLTLFEAIGIADKVNEKECWGSVCVYLSSHWRRVNGYCAHKSWWFPDNRCGNRKHSCKAMIFRCPKRLLWDNVSLCGT